MLVLDQKSQVVSGKAFWKGSENFNGRVFITYDSLYLYAAVIVEKNRAPVNNNEKLSLWNGDCLELFLSTESNAKKTNGISEGDYHIGFSPGTNCKNPQMFCFNKNKDIEGGRVIARETKTGYILESAVPLTFFEGLELGPGKQAGLNVALDEGGQISGNRLMQLDYSGNPLAGEHPGSWPKIQWSGSGEVVVPKNDEEDRFAGRVADGTKGATYLGMKNPGGFVSGWDGKPLAGVKVSTWPKTKEVLTDAAGRFQFSQIKIYDKTLFYARREGGRVAMAVLPAKGAPATLQLQPLPRALSSSLEQSEGALAGLTLRLPASHDLDEVTAKTKDRTEALHLKILRLNGTESLAGAPGSEKRMIDQFVAYARALGAEPMMEVPVNRDNPSMGADWVRYCNLEKKYNVVFWTVGDEPDLYDSDPAAESFADYSVYDYINDFRSVYNKMKAVDPSICVLGPELAVKYTDGVEDWLTPFIRYDGDIVDAVSVHHYSALKAADCEPRKVLSDIRGETTLLHNLRDKISGNSDIPIPLVVTGGNSCREAAAVKKGQEDSGPGSFWAALWMADMAGSALGEGLGLNLFSYLGGGGGLDILTEAGPRPAYWALWFVSALPAGHIVSSQINKDDISVHAVQDEKSKDLTLFLVNKGDHYFSPKIRLDGKEADLTAEAGLKDGIDFEIPSYSIACLTIKGDHSPGQSVLYTKKMFLAGQTPETKVLKSW